MSLIINQTFVPLYWVMRTAGSGRGQAVVVHARPRRR